MLDNRVVSEGNHFNLKNFKDQGFQVLKNFLEKDLIAKVLQDWEDFHAAQKDSLLTNDEPLVVFWRHVVGEKKKLRPISEFPAIKQLAFHARISSLVKEITASNEVRLLETIIFSKPPKVSNTLNWHQDVAYFPFDPNNQVAVWIPLEPVTKANGAMQYVLGSHKQGLMGSVDLHSGTPFKNEDRMIIPADPEKAGFEVHCCEINPGDMIVHDGHTWHCSGPNLTTDQQRRGLSLRYLVGETCYKPRAGSAASFIAQVEVKPGDKIEGPAFPRV